MSERYQKYAEYLTSVHWADLKISKFDVVGLMSGGPAMTVIAMSGDDGLYNNCCWFDADGHL